MKQLIALFTLLVLSYSCSNDDVPAVVVPELPVNTYVVGCGSEDINEVRRAVIWENGVPTFLSAPSQEGYAYGVVVKNGVVHVVGYERNSNYKLEAKYWKNGVSQNLGVNTSTDSQAVSVCVDNNDVYVLGNQNGVVKYWKNGVENAITQFNNGVYPIGISVSNGNIYILVDDNHSAKLWKNGIVTTLSDGIKIDLVRALCVKNNDVYVLADENYNSLKIKYWKNGVVHYVPSSNNIQTSSISVVNNDVYIGGFEDNKAKYWKNGTPVVLNSAGAFSVVWAFTIFNGNVYSTGVDQGKLKIWKNKKVINPTSTSFNDDPYSIFVTQ